MVDARITDGRRIAELLASELDGREDGVLDRVAVTNADRDVEPTVEGARAYDITAFDRRVARVYIHDDRARLEFDIGHEPATSAAEEGDLRVRPKAIEPPKTLVFVERGAEVKHASDVVQAVVRSIETATD